MNCFVVVLRSGNADAKQIIESKFENRHYTVLPDSVWVIASEKSAPSDICEMLGIQRNTGITGLVVRTDEYNGFFNRALWEKMSEWEDMS